MDTSIVEKEKLETTKKCLKHNNKAENKKVGSKLLLEPL
jgi:hypothetical protein